MARSFYHLTSSKNSILHLCLERFLRTCTTKKGITNDKGNAILNANLDILSLAKKHLSQLSCVSAKSQFPCILISRSCFLLSPLFLRLCWGIFVRIYKTIIKILKLLFDPMFSSPKCNLITFIIGDNIKSLSEGNRLMDH